MDPFDDEDADGGGGDAAAQPHPSEPIPDAAYPGVPYVPGQGPQQLPTEPSSAHLPARVATVGRWRESPDIYPSGEILRGPPPPYEPNRPWSSGRGAEAAARATTEAVAEAADAAADRGSSPGAGIPLQDLPATGDDASANGSDSDSTLSSIESRKRDEDAASRRRRRVVICRLVLAALLVFGVALTLGIVLGLWRARRRRLANTLGPVLIHATEPP